MVVPNVATIVAWMLDTGYWLAVGAHSVTRISRFTNSAHAVPLAALAQAVLLD
jgi:hypothetical protein